MFVIVISEGEAFSVEAGALLEFLDMRAAGGERHVDRYGISVGEALTDISRMDKNTALALSERLRADLRRDRPGYMAA